jgi:hypothetical protein
MDDRILECSTAGYLRARPQNIGMEFCRIIYLRTEK